MSKGKAKVKGVLFLEEKKNQKDLFKINFGQGRMVRITRVSFGSNLLLKGLRGLGRRPKVLTIIMTG